jgi:hypothetical protein
MTAEEREALEWLQGLPVANPGTEVADHVAIILLMLAGRDPVAAMIARSLKRQSAGADEADEGRRSIPPRDGSSA